MAIIESPITTDTTLDYTHSFGGQFVINNGATFTVAEHAHFSVTNTSDYALVNNGKIVVSQNATFTAIRNEPRAFYAASYLGNADIYGNFIADNGLSTAYLQVSKQKTVNVYGAIELTNGTLATAGTINLYDGASVYADRIVFNQGSAAGDATAQGHGKIVVKNRAMLSPNAYTTVGTNSKGEYDFSDSTESILGVIAIQDNAELTIALPSESMIISKFANVAYGSDMTGTLYIKDFANDKFFIGDTKNLTVVGADTIYVSGTQYTNAIKLVALDADGNEIVLDKADKWIIDTNGALNIVATAIPEPAEWAAIFGAFALGLAVYRRRK